MLTAKEILITFVNFIFSLIVIGLTILYFIAGENFENFRHILESLVPLGILGILFLVNLKFSQEKSKKREREGNTDVTLLLRIGDKLKSDLFLFAFPVLIIIIAFIVDHQVGKTDVVMAGTVFVVAYLWQKWIFSKERMN